MLPSVVCPIYCRHQSSSFCPRLKYIYIHIYISTHQAYTSSTRCVCCVHASSVVCFLCYLPSAVQHSPNPLSAIDKGQCIFCSHTKYCPLSVGIAGSSVVVSGVFAAAIAGSASAVSRRVCLRRCGDGLRWTVRPMGGRLASARYTRRLC